MKGKLVKYFPDEGYGFIVAEREYFFCSSRDLKGNVSVGDNVTFDPIETKKGMRARNVKGVEAWQTK